ncbi:hypothetical protein V461_21740 [Pantoea ananatis BRT98]|nr:hypothetical protein V461_21740 [Pantoea ananatis BRT98]
MIVKSLIFKFYFLNGIYFYNITLIELTGENDA